MTTRRTRSTDRTQRSVGSWMVAVTAAVFGLAALLVMTSTAAAGGDPGCPPPSAQLASTQPQLNCSAVGETHLTTLPSTLIGEPVEVDFARTPTGTTTLPGTAP
jgi:hypothetical protein